MNPPACQRWTRGRARYRPAHETIRTADYEVAAIPGDGTVFAPRAAQKIRARDQGWRYASAQLERAGAAPLGEHEDAAAWLARWLPALTRPVRHPGNLRYAWALRRGIELPPALPFPSGGLAA